MVNESEIENIYIPIGRSVIHCKRTGEGNELLIAFPGFGERSVMFDKIGKELGEKYTVFAVDLPMHGESRWRGRKRITTKIFEELIVHILHLENKSQCALMGFSFGGRIALCLQEKIPDKIKGLYLIAPDGVHVTYAYRAFTNVPDYFKRAFFKLLAAKPVRRRVGWMYRKGWIGHHNYRFVKTQCNTRRKRRRLLLYWMSLDRLSPEWEEAKYMLSEQGGFVKLFMAIQDEVVTKSTARILTEGIDRAEVVFINSNHTRLKKIFFERLGEYL